METQILSIEEANARLPLIRRIVVDITTGWEQIIKQRSELDTFERNIQGKYTEIQLLEQKSRKENLNYLIDKINEYIHEVENLGCFVEEFRRGIINFPCLFHGRKVFLCWCPDDKEVIYWHELDECFSDRTKIGDPKAFLYRAPKKVAKPAPARATCDDDSL